MSDLNFVTDGTIERVCAQRSRRHEVLREVFTHRLSRLQDDAERMTDICRDLIRAGANPTEELKEAETFIKALSLLLMVLQREAQAAG